MKIAELLPLKVCPFTLKMHYLWLKEKKNDLFIAESLEARVEFYAKKRKLNSGEAEPTVSTSEADWDSRNLIGCFIQ